MRIPWITVVAAALVLAGCATPAEQAARMEREMDRYVQVYGPACDKLGFKRDTDPWRNCVLGLAQQDSYMRYGSYPTSTTCMGGPGLLHCTTF
ncbi:MAG TPA: hypothetical protein VJ576_13320 [Rhodocyclaceae bacterium]|nr:hypothetical protein [Rhodocyclaceae bacterium]